MHEHSERQFDSHFQTIERRVQRVGWLVLAIILTLAILGLFGGGLLGEGSKTTSVADSKLTLEYPRFGRLQNRNDLTLAIEAPGQTAEEVRVVLSGEFLSKVSIVGVTPDPDSTAVGMQAAIYNWQVEDWSSPIEVTIQYEPKQWRSISGDISVTAGEKDLGNLGFDLWVFP